jgi:ABC-type multidrug transport system permease subunit
MLIVVGFDVPMEGSFAALALGAVLLIGAATAFGLVISAFVESQIAAQFASSIIVMIPTMNFSGYLYPVSTLDGAAAVIGNFSRPIIFSASAPASSTRAWGSNPSSPTIWRWPVFAWHFSALRPCC